jgi:hypothetical protein
MLVINVFGHMLIFFYTRILDPNVLPPEAVEAGFQARPISNPYYGPFALKPGPKNPSPDHSPLEVLQLYMDDALIKQFIINACKVQTEKKWEDEVSHGAFWRYVTAVLADGVVQYAEEQDAYRSSKANVAGLYGNSLLRNLHTFEQWQHAKQMFYVPLGVLTDAFNRKSAELVTPAR